MKRKFLITMMIGVTCFALTACGTKVTESNTKIENTEVQIEETIAVDTETEIVAEEIAEPTAEVVKETTEESEAEAVEETEEAETTTEEVEESEAEAEEIIEETSENADVKGATIVDITDVNDTVWATTTCNVRAGYGTDYDVVGSLGYANSIQRTGICSNGWSRVNYNGSEAYIKTSLLSETEIKKPEAPAPQPATPQAEETVQVAIPTNVDSYAYEVLTIVNDYRAANGLSPLTWSDGLASAASIRAAEAVTCWSHTRPDGSAWKTVSNLTHGENLGRGYNSPQAVVDAWKASPGHNANLLEPKFKTLGVSYVVTDKGYVWAQEFGF